MSHPIYDLNGILIWFVNRSFIVYYKQQLLFFEFLIFSFIFRAIPFISILVKERDILLGLLAWA